MHCNYASQNLSMLGLRCDLDIALLENMYHMMSHHTKTRSKALPFCRITSKWLRKDIDFHFHFVIWEAHALNCVLLSKTGDSMLWWLGVNQLISLKLYLSFVRSGWIIRSIYAPNQISELLDACSFWNWAIG